MTIFRSDCSNCCGLCCVAPAQLAVQGFPEDKPAEIPCVHLDDNQRCAIHAGRSEFGYQACHQFDCFGAGQWITQHLFDGEYWTDSAETADRMFSAYRHWLPRFEAAALLEAALPFVGDEARCSLITRMAALVAPDTSIDVVASDPNSLRRETLALIHSAMLAVDPGV